ncbi:hypothetical protein TNCV_2581111 [Trichonephila clavipes]|nr:hypothetical protein TNCV_2581111 [Trichonephila clavipes]
MNSVASTLNRVTDKEFNNQISVLTPNKWNTWKHDIQSSSVDETRFGEKNAYLSSFTSKKSKTLPGATAAAHGDPNGKNDYQKNGDLKPITNMKMSLATEDKSCPVEGIGTLRFRGFSDLSEQQEALMVEVTIPNCYKQAIRSRDASKWHDAMDKEINAVGSLVVRALDSRPEDIGSMPDVTKYPPSTCLLNQWVQKSCGRSQLKPRAQETGEYFPPLQFHA